MPSTTRARRASPRTLAIAGGVVLIVVIAVVLGIVLSGGSTSNAHATGLPPEGDAQSKAALPESTFVRNLYKGIPQTGLVLGSPHAPATLTEFIDLQCPLCQEFETRMMPTIVQKYVRTGKLDIKLEPWSILSAPDSPRGQAATIAASLQNKGFQFAELLYYNQGQEDSGWLTQYMVGKAAASIDGLVPQRVLADETSAGVKTLVRKIDKTASADQFSGTPTLLLNHEGQPAQIAAIGVPATLSSFESMIQHAIAG